MQKAKAIEIDTQLNQLLLIALFSTLFLVNFLFFIDEGYNSFYWMTLWGNWVVFAIYTAVLFSIQALAIFLFPFKNRIVGKFMISLYLVVPIYSIILKLLYI